MSLSQSHGECWAVSPHVFELGDDDVLRRTEPLFIHTWEASPPNGPRTSAGA